MKIPARDSTAYMLAELLRTFGPLTREDLYKRFSDGRKNMVKKALSFHLGNGWLNMDGYKIVLGPLALDHFDLADDYRAGELVKSRERNLMLQPSLDKKHFLKWPGMRDIRFKTIGG